MFSLTPFYTLYTTLYDTTNTAATTTDIFHQLDLLWHHCRLNTSSSSNLLTHGYDASRTATWADPVTGGSPHVWGRSLGWYAMALVDTLEALPPTTTAQAEEANAWLARFADLAAAIADAVSVDDGAWWQVLDQPGRAGNYLESSGSAMFVYALFKGVRLGYLGERECAANWTDVAVRAYGYVVDHFVVEEGDGTVGYNGTVAVCSLNSTASFEVCFIPCSAGSCSRGCAAFLDGDGDFADGGFCSTTLVSLFCTIASWVRPLSFLLHWSMRASPPG